MTVNLGDKAKDRITGVEGIVVSRSSWLTGCDRIALQPKADKEGKVPDLHWVDEPMLDIVTKGAIKPVTVDADRGGPRPDPKRR